MSEPSADVVPGQIGGASAQPSGFPIPLTERVLARLPGPRMAWMLLWAASQALLLGLLAMIFPGRVPDFGHVVVNGDLVTYANFVALWGVGRLARDVASLRPTLAQLTTGTHPSWEPFRAIGYIGGPILAVIGINLLFGLESLVRAPELPLLLVLAGNLVGALPLTTLTWVNGVILFDLNRLGGMPLRLRSFEEDRSLGSRPLGSLGFTAFWVVLLAILPLLFFGADELVDVVFTVSLVVGGAVLLLLSMVRLHRQLVAAKRTHLQRAHEIFARAFRPAWSAPSPEALGDWASALISAESMERRAAAIQEWPFDEGIFRTLLALVTSVVAAIIARVILIGLGF